MKLFIWTYNFGESEDDGESVAMAVANNIDEAKLLVKANLDDDDAYEKFIDDGELEILDTPCAQVIMN